MSAYAATRGIFTPINQPGQSTIGGGGEDPKKPHDPSKFNPKLHYTEETEDD